MRQSLLLSHISPVDACISSLGTLIYLCRESMLQVITLRGLPLINKSSRTRFSTQLGSHLALRGCMSNCPSFILHVHLDRHLWTYFVFNSIYSHLINLITISNFQL